MTIASETTKNDEQITPYSLQTIQMGVQKPSTFHMV
jgi:hypothetical protein